MTFEMLMEEKFEAGMEKGIKKGREEGITKGLEQGAYNTKLETALHSSQDLCASTILDAKKTPSM